MWAMTKQDRDDLDAYRALGSVEEIRARLTGPLPDDEDRAPMPMTDPAEYSAMNYGNAWDERDTRLLDDGSTKRSGELFGNPEQVRK